MSNKRSLFDEEQSVAVDLNKVGDGMVKLTTAIALVFNPEPRSFRNYGISIKYYQGEDEQPYKRVDYTIELSVRQYKNLENTWQLSFDKKELFINRHEPDLVAEQLAHLAMQSLYPVKVDVNSSNEVFRGIVNHPEMIKRWQETVANIDKKYTGDYIGLFVDKMNHMMADKWKIEQALGYDMFWSVFFHPQYFSYDQDLTKDMVFTFPIFPYQCKAFEGKQVLNRKYTEYRTCKIEFNSFPVQDQRKDGEPKTWLNAEFDLEIEGGLLKHAVINCGSVLTNGEADRRVQFSAYQIPDAENEGFMVKEDFKTTIVNEDTATPSPLVKKGFWERILG